MFYFILFLAFVYLKIFRVRKELESLSGIELAEAGITVLAMISLLVFGFMTMTWYVVLLSAFSFFIMAALMVSAVQLGVFVDGKPILVMSQIYKLTPLLGLSVVVGTVITLT